MRAGVEARLTTAAWLLRAVVVAFAVTAAYRTWLAGGSAALLVPAAAVVAAGSAVLVSPRTLPPLVRGPALAAVAVAVCVPWPWSPVVWTGTLELLAALVLITLPRRAALPGWLAVFAATVVGTAVRDGGSVAVLYGAGVPLLSVALAVPVEAVRSARTLLRLRADVVRAEVGEARTRHLRQITTRLEPLLDEVAADVVRARAQLDHGPAAAAELCAGVATRLRAAHADVRRFARLAGGPVGGPPPRAEPGAAYLFRVRAGTACVLAAVPVVAAPVLFCVLGVADAPPVAHAPVAVLLGSVALAAYGRLVVDAVRPVRRPATTVPLLLVLAAVAFGPLPWWAGSWFTMLLLVVAGVAVALTGPVRAVLLAVLGLVILVLPVVGTVAGGEPADVVAGAVLAGLVGLPVVGALAASVPLTRTLAEVRATGARLVAVGAWRARVRTGRDLHDLLGQSLAAGALCADVVVRRLAAAGVADPQARAYAADLLVEVDRARGEVRQLRTGTRRLTPEQELADAAVLLARSGVAVELDAAGLGELSEPVRDAVAWTIREAATNIVRHSAARTCTVTLTAGPGGSFRLAVVNDGARAPGDRSGSGLRALSQRVTEAGTRLAYARDGDSYRVTLTGAGVPVPAGPP